MGIAQDKGEGSGRFARALCLVMLLLLLAPSSGQAQECRLPSDLMSLLRTLSVLPASVETVGPALSDRVSENLSEISERRVLADLEAGGLVSLSGLAIDLMSEAERLSSQDARVDGRRLQTMLREIDEQTRITCTEGGNGAAQASQQERLGGVLMRGEVDWQALERQLESRPVVSAAALLGALSAVVLFLCIFDFIARWAMALVYNRKICRIPADLVIGNRSIGGMVVTLGRGGFRFNPLDAGAFDDKAEAQALNMAELTVVGFNPQVCRMSHIHGTVIDFRFDERLSLAVQRGLLAMSTISPFYVRKARDGGLSATSKVLGMPID